MKPEQIAEGCYCWESGCFLSNMYLLLPQSAGEARAVVIDPWRSEALYALLSERGISRLLVLLTHEHFDHTTGVNALREQFEVELVCHSACAQSIGRLRCNVRSVSWAVRRNDASHKRSGFTPAQPIGPLTAHSHFRGIAAHWN